MNKNKTFATKEIIVQKYSDKYGCSKTVAKEYLEGMLEIITDCLASAEYNGVIFRNLLSIEKTVKKARSGENPINGIVYNAPESIKLKINTGKILEQKINS